MYFKYINRGLLVTALLNCIAFSAVQADDMNDTHIIPIEGRLKALEESVKKLQKGVVDGVPATTSTAHSNDAITAADSDGDLSDVNEQFKAIRADIEKIQRDMSVLNNKVLELSANMEKMQGSSAYAKQLKSQEAKKVDQTTSTTK